MDLSEYVRQVILIDQSPAAEEYLHERIASCFVDDPNQCRLTLVQSKCSDINAEDPPNKPNSETVLSNPSIEELKKNLKVFILTILNIFVNSRSSYPRSPAYSCMPQTSKT